MSRSMAGRSSPVTEVLPAGVARARDFARDAAQDDELARARREVRERLHAALRRASAMRELPSWWVVIGARHRARPLSGGDSQTGVGGRFNVGEVDDPMYPTFRALYLAEEREAGERALRAEQSIAAGRTLTIGAGGRLETMLDLGDGSVLAEVVEILSGLEKHLAPEVVGSPAALRAALLSPDWAAVPTHAGVPSASQVFGSIVRAAGICGIHYPSPSGVACAAVFLDNLPGTRSGLMAAQWG